MTFELTRDLAAALLGGRAGLFTRFVIACVVFTAAAAAGRALLPVRTRLWWLVAVSLALVTACTTPAIAAIAVVYAIAFYAASERLPRGPVRTAVVAMLLVLQVAGAILWLPRLPGYTGIVREFVAFATNLFFLRSWAWAFDRALDGPARSVPDYALYTFYWPAFASGPFFSPHQLGERRQAWYWADGDRSAPPLGPAVRRIARGFVALALLTLAAWSLTPEAYLRATTGPVAHAWLHTVGVYFAVYLGFSAWTDASVGFAQLSGIVLPENFNHAERAYGPADFWRRWNMSLGAWMHEYVYVPLGGAHPGGRRDRLAWWNIAAVFAAVALYHHVGGLKLLGPGVVALPGFWLPWSLWALYNTLGTLVTRRWRAPDRLGPRDWAVIAVTFAFSAVGLTTAFYPLTLPIADVLDLYRTLLLGGLP